MIEIKPGIDENGEPVCSGRRCPSYPPLTVEGLKEQCWGPQNECVPAIRQQRDEAQAKLAKWNNRVLKLEHELEEKTELAARLMEEAEKWKGKTEKLLEFVDIARTAPEQGLSMLPLAAGAVLSEVEGDKQ